MFIINNTIIHVVVVLRYFAIKWSYQVHERSQAVSDGSQAVHELVLCIGINGYKRSF